MELQSILTRISKNPKFIITEKIVIKTLFLQPTILCCIDNTTFKIEDFLQLGTVHVSVTIKCNGKLTQVILSYRIQT